MTRVSGRRSDDGPICRHNSLDCKTPALITPNSNKNKEAHTGSECKSKHVEHTAAQDKRVSTMKSQEAYSDDSIKKTQKPEGIKSQHSEKNESIQNIVQEYISHNHSRQHTVGQVQSHYYQDFIVSEFIIGSQGKYYEDAIYDNLMHPVTRMNDVSKSNLPVSQNTKNLVKFMPYDSETKIQDGKLSTKTFAQ